MFGPGGRGQGGSVGMDPCEDQLHPEAICDLPGPARPWRKMSPYAPGADLWVVALVPKLAIQKGYS